MSLLLPLLLASPVQAADPILPAGRDVDPAMYVDITRYALEKQKVESIFQNFLPTSIPIDSLAGDQLNQDGSVGSSLLGVEYELKVQGLVIEPTLLYVNTVPTAGGQCRPNSPDYPANGYLEVALGVNVGLNDAAHPAAAHVNATAEFLGLGFTLVDDDCSIWMTPQPATVEVKVAIGFPIDDNDLAGHDDGHPDPFPMSPPGKYPNFCPYRPQDWAAAAAAAGVDAPCRPLFVDIYDFSWHFGNDEQGVQLSDIDLHCGSLLSLLQDVASSTGLLPEDIIADTLAQSVDPQIEQMLTDVETQLQDSLDQLFDPDAGYKFHLPEPVSFLGTQVDFELCPNDVTVDDRGIRIGMSGKVIAGDEPAACVAAYDPKGSLVTVPPTGRRYPELGRYDVEGYSDVLHEPQSPEPTNPPEVAFGVNDDFLNQALYSLWRGGLLCQTFSGENSPLELPAGLSFDTGLLNTLSASAFEEAFPPDPITRKGKPLLVTTRPEKPPVVATATSGPNTAYIELEDFGIDMYAESEYRQVRAVGLTIAAQPGLGLAFDGQTGQVSAAIDLDPTALAPRVVYNELAPSASATLESGLGQLISSFVGPILDDALGGFVFQLPSFAGLGVQDLTLDATGPGHDFLGGYGKVGFVQYGDTSQTGCDAFGSGCGGGCGAGGSGCSGGGCDTGRGARGLGLLLLPALVIARRRRP
jgi:hypothetical protein